MKIRLGNRELVLQSPSSISRSMSDGIGEWNANIAWIPGQDQELDNLIIDKRKIGYFKEALLTKEITDAVNSVELESIEIVF